MVAPAALGSYINDHLGGATAGVAMAQRLEHDLRDGPAAERLVGISGEIQEDLRDLRRIVHRLGIRQSPAKQAVGWAGEKLHRLGVRELAPGGPRLRRLRAVESLALEVEGKGALWTALLEVAHDHPQLGPNDLQRLTDRARDQRQRIETVRLSVARRAFVTGV